MVPVDYVKLSTREVIYFYLVWSRWPTTISTTTNTTTTITTTSTAYSSVVVDTE